MINKSYPATTFENNWIQHSNILFATKLVFPQFFHLWSFTFPCTSPCIIQSVNNWSSWRIRIRILIPITYLRNTIDHSTRLCLRYNWEMCYLLSCKGKMFKSIKKNCKFRFKRWKATFHLLFVSKVFRIILLVFPYLTKL